MASILMVAALAGTGLEAANKADLADPATVEGLNEMALGEVNMNEMRVLLKEPGTVILDARAGAFYALGHLPGALSFPRNELEARWIKMLDHLKAVRPKRIIVYCTDKDCTDSHVVARRLLSAGYRDVSIFPGGWAEWQNPR